jgi:hypothetical protein
MVKGKVEGSRERHGRYVVHNEQIEGKGKQLKPKRVWEAGELEQDIYI